MLKSYLVSRELNNIYCLIFWNGYIVTPSIFFMQRTLAPAFVFVFCVAASHHLDFPSVSLSQLLSLIWWNKAECWNGVIISPDWCSILSSKQLANCIFRLWPSENEWCEWPALCTSTITTWGTHTHTHCICTKVHPALQCQKNSNSS